MKERLDCALISVPGSEALISSLLSHERLPTSRLHFSVIEPATQAGQPPGAPSAKGTHGTSASQVPLGNSTGSADAPSSSSSTSCSSTGNAGSAGSRGISRKSANANKSDVSASSAIPGNSGNDTLSTFPSATFLQELTYSLRHYDVICLPVSPGSLVWTRIVLQQSRIEDHRPIFVLGQSLRPIGLIDLLELGVVDFALWPCDPEEIRVRLLRALHHLRGHYFRSPALLGDSIKSQPYVSDRLGLDHLMSERFGPDRLRPHEGNPARCLSFRRVSVCIHLAAGSRNA